MPSEFPARSDSNQTVQPKMMATGLKFHIWEVEGLETSNFIGLKLNGLFFLRLITNSKKAARGRKIDNKLTI